MRPVFHPCSLHIYARYSHRKFFFLIHEEEKTGEKVNAINGPDECMQRCVPEAIQEVIDLTGFLCFLFRSTPNIMVDNDEI